MRIDLDTLEIQSKCLRWKESDKRSYLKNNKI